jgi:predicted PurR-regulated permease PerM
LTVVPAPLVMAGWLGVAVMSGYLLHVGRGVLIPLALASLFWQLINAASHRFDRVRIGGRPLQRWQRLVVGAVLAVLAMWLFANLVLSNVGAGRRSRPTCWRFYRGSPASSACHRRRACPSWWPRSTSTS